MFDVKSNNFEIKANIDTRIFEGYASTWHKDLVNDQIVKGAFAKTIKDRQENIKVLWQHGAPIGRSMSLHEDDNGLYVKARISKTQLGDEALELMRDGVVDEMSIGYKVLQDEYAKNDDTRYLKELKLFEFSPVTFGANPFTTITSVKSLDAIANGFRALDQEIKAGRVFSKPNLEKLRLAQNHLAELISLMEQSDEPMNITQDDLKSLFSDLKSINKIYKGESK